MGWFDEQIKLREENDNNLFSETFENIGNAVLGKPSDNVEEEDYRAAWNAIEQIFLYFHIKGAKVPEGNMSLDEELDFILQPKNIMRRRIKLDGNWMSDAVGPMLGFIEADSTLVAFIPSKHGGYYYFDSKTHKKVHITKKNKDQFSKEAYVFYKSLPLRPITLKDIFVYTLSVRTVHDWVLMVISYAIAALIGLLLPNIQQILFSDVIEVGSMQVLVSMGVFVLGAAVAQVLITTEKTLLETGVETKVDMAMESATMMRILSLPIGFFKEYSAGELSSYVTKLNTISGLIDSVILSSGMTSVFSLIYIVQIFQFAPGLVAPALIVIALTILCSLMFTFSNVKYTRELYRNKAKDSGLSYALINGIQKIKLSGAEKRAFSKWGKLYSEGARMEYNPPLAVKYYKVPLTAVTLFGNLAMYILAIKTNVSVSDYYAFTTSYGMVSAAFTGLADLAVQAAVVKPILDNAKHFMDAVPEVRGDKEYVSDLEGSIELSHVTFRYDQNMPPILDDLSLKINPGQYVAVVGKTGCGKSTLVRILLGFEQPEKGTVYYDGKDIKSLDQKSLRKKIGTVLQDGKLMMGDIYLNIAITCPTLTIDEAWEAAELAGIDQDIKAMPMGMNTIISEGSGVISGGQRQRLMIARAVAPKPRILIMDEATSALDNITQKHVSDALDRLECTRLIIAHRLSTIRQCERILVLDGGHIIEDGTYDELIALNGFFAELVERLRLDTEMS